MSKIYKTKTQTDTTMSFLPKTELTDECIGKLATAIALAMGKMLFGDRARSAEEDDTIVHCNIKENAELIAKILDADVEDRAWRGEER